MGKFTHIDEQGQVRMVDVTDKTPSERVAVAQGVVSMNPATFEKCFPLLAGFKFKAIPLSKVSFFV